MPTALAGVGFLRHLSVSVFLHGSSKIATAGLAESNGWLPPSGWLAGWLPVHWDQLQAQRSVTSMGSLYLFTISQELMQLESPNLIYRCSTVSPGKPFIWGQKIKGKKSRVTKQCWRGLGLCTLVSAGFF